MFIRRIQQYDVSPLPQLFDDSFHSYPFLALLPLAREAHVITATIRLRLLGVEYDVFPSIADHILLSHPHLALRSPKHVLKLQRIRQIQRS